MEKTKREMKIEKAIKNLEANLKQAEENINSTFLYSVKLLRRIQFLERGEVARHESNKDLAELYRKSGYFKEGDQEKYNATMNYKFPEWIEEDRQRHCPAPCDNQKARKQRKNVKELHS